MRCTYPLLCIHYQEIERPDKFKIPICLLKDIEINYKNIQKIENCLDHETYKQRQEKWKISPLQ